MMLTTRNGKGLDLVNDFDRIMNSFMRWDEGGSDRYPLVDIRENENQYYLEADLPGRKEDEIELRVNDGVLTISSLQSKERTVENEGYLLRERKNSTFARSFALPKNADGEGITAHYHDGILSLTIPKREDAKPRTIKIKRG